MKVPLKAGVQGQAKLRESNPPYRLREGLGEGPTYVLASGPWGLTPPPTPPASGRGAEECHFDSVRRLCPKRRYPPAKAGAQLERYRERRAAFR